MSPSETSTLTGLLTFLWLVATGFMIFFIFKRKWTMMFFSILGGAICIGLIGNMNPAHPTMSAAVAATGDYKSNGWNLKATTSESRAARLAGFTDDASSKNDYHVGLQHIAHQHSHLGNYTIGQVAQIGQNINLAQVTAKANAEAAAQKRIDDAKAAEEQRHAAAQAAEEANFQHGDPDCLTLDKRTLSTDSDEVASYFRGTVTNGCNRDLLIRQLIE
jgi:hypothetical protein